MRWWFWLVGYWDWFFYFRRGKIRIRVWPEGDVFKAIASNGKVYIWNCYGSTPEHAKQLALFKLKQALEEMSEAK